MIHEPVWHPDQIIYGLDDLPLSWVVSVRHNGQPLDLDGRTARAPVTDDGLEMGALDLQVINASTGTVEVTLTADLYSKLSRLSTWWLRIEPEFRGPLVRGRIVRNY